MFVLFIFVSNFAHVCTYEKLLQNFTWRSEGKQIHDIMSSEQLWGQSFFVVDNPFEPGKDVANIEAILPVYKKFDQSRFVDQEGVLSYCSVFLFNETSEHITYFFPG